jgi:tRNA threonylcarbamoyladenosine dehydratase
MLGVNTLTDPQLNQAPDLERRFGGLARLYGEAGAQRIARAHVCVVGVGGVGSWAAECLARSGVGTLTLIDLDNVAESNINRQVHALTVTLGMPKVAALSERIAQINPGCKVLQIEDFVAPENVQTLVPKCGALIDCTDQVRAKTALAAHCRAQNIAFIMCGAAGGKRDAARLAVTDLSQTTHDPLLAKVRTLLRRDYGFARAATKAQTATKTARMHVSAVYSTEAVKMPEVCEDGPQGLSCAGYGSAMHVTAAMGLLAAGQVLNWIAEQDRRYA